MKSSWSYSSFTQAHLPALLVPFSNYYLLAYSSKSDPFLHCFTFQVNSSSKRQTIFDSLIISAPHSPITALHQGSDLHSIIIGYATGEVLIGFFDEEDEELIDLPYGISYYTHGKRALNNHFVFVLLDVK